MRGMAFYSLMALVLILPSLLFVIYYVGQHQGNTFSIDAVLSDQVYQIHSNLENDFQRAAAISGRRALLAMGEKVITTGNPLADPKAAFIELINNSTIDGDESLVMKDNSITDWIEEVSNVQSGFNVGIKLEDVSIKNKDGFNLLMSARISINVSDSSNVSSISGVFDKNISISVEGLEDPLFPLMTSGAVKRVIEKYDSDYHALQMSGSNSEGNCSGTVTFDEGAADKASKILVTQTASASDYSAFVGVVSEDSIILSQAPYNVNCYVSGVTNATQKVTENETLYIDEPSNSAWHLPMISAIPGGYYHRGDGPNYLQRLEGDCSPSDEGTGIETFLLPAEETTSYPEKSRLGYHYLSSQTHQACRKARWFEEWFRLKPQDMADYNISGLSYGVC